MLELFLSLMVACETADCLVVNTPKSVTVIMCVDEPVAPSTTRHSISYVGDSKTLFVHVDNCRSL